MPPLSPLLSIGFIGNLAGVDLLLLLLIPLFIFWWAWVLFDAISKEPQEGSDRLIWVLVIVLTQIVGAAIYFFVRRPQRIRKYGH